MVKVPVPMIDYHLSLLNVISAATFGFHPIILTKLLTLLIYCSGMWALYMRIVILRASAPDSAGSCGVARSLVPRHHRLGRLQPIRRLGLLHACWAGIWPTLPVAVRRSNVHLDICLDR